MKKLFLLFGMSAIIVSGYAQQTGNRYGVSVFAGSGNIQLLQRADAGVAAKLQSQFPGWYIQTDQWTGGFRDLNGKAISIPGATLADKAVYAMDHLLGSAGVQSANWKLTSTAVNKKGFQYLYFSNEQAGHKVAFAKMVFRFDAAGKLARITSNAYGHADLSLKTSLTTDDALTAAQKDLDGVVITHKEISSDWEWFAIPSAKGYTLHPAYAFVIDGNTQNLNDAPLHMKGYVDAITGDLLYRDNEIHDAADVKIAGTVYKDGVLKPATDQPLADLELTIGSSTYYTDKDGLFSDAGMSFPLNITSIPLSGKYSVVKALGSSGVTPDFSTIVTATGSTYVYPTTSPSSSRHVNAYYHVNRVHDFMREHFTAFTKLDYPLVTNVDDPSGACNAYYTGAGGSSINFYAAGSGCSSFAEIGDIIYHEYGHAISDKFYVDKGVSSMRNGALNEGNSDIWAISITGNPILGQGSSTGGGGLIRRYDLAPKVYPANIVGEVHADGEIIAGAWWDVAVNMSGNVKFMGDLFTSTYFDVPDGPNGTEGQVYFEVLMSALVNDDDDGDLSNGTPNFTAIAKAFARHGIFLLSDAKLDHAELAHQPGATPIEVTAKATLTNPSFFQGINLVYKVRGSSWDTVKMVDAGSLNFKGTIPAQAAGTIIDYYFAVNDLLNNAVLFPQYFYTSTSAVQTTLPYQFAVGVTPKQITNFESALSGWQIGIGTDNATQGKWIQAVPVASYVNSVLCQTGADHTSGTGKCLVTGNAAAVGSAPTSESVRNGVTTVVTPVIDLTGYTKPIIEYYRWFGNDKGTAKRKDNWQVQISTSAGTFWKDVDNTYQSDYQWRRRIFSVRDYFITTGVQLRFLAKEVAAVGSAHAIVESGIDDFTVYEGTESGSGIAGVAVSPARIYPNPATDEVQIELPEGTFSSVSIKLYDIGGKLVSEIPADNSNTHYNVNTKALAAGQYLMMIRMDKTIQAHKVTIQHP